MPVTNKVAAAKHTVRSRLYCQVANINKLILTLYCLDSQTAQSLTMHVGRVHSTIVPPLLDSVSNELQSALCRWWCSIYGCGSFIFLASSLHSVQDAERYITRGIAEVWTIAFVDATCSVLMIYCTIELERVPS